MGGDSRGNMGTQRARNKRSHPGLPRTPSITVVRENEGKKRDLKKVKCFNCNKYGHFARSCTEAKVNCFNDSSKLCVSSIVFLTESNPLWIVDSGATYHIAKDRGAFVEYRRIPEGSKWIYVGNNTRVAVKGIGTCKLVLEGGHTLLLHDVLFAPDIRRNIISVVVMLGLGYEWHFHDNLCDLVCNNSYIGSGHVSKWFHCNKYNLRFKFYE